MVGVGRGVVAEQGGDRMPARRRSGDRRAPCTSRSRIAGRAHAASGNLCSSRESRAVRRRNVSRPLMDSGASIGMPGRAGRHRRREEVVAERARRVLGVALGEGVAQLGDRVEALRAGAHTVSKARGSSQSRSFACASRNLDFTVPSGMPSARATSCWVIPCQKANSIARRCASGSRSMARRTDSAMAARFRRIPETRRQIQDVEAFLTGPAPHRRAYCIDRAPMRQHAEIGTQGAALGIEPFRVTPQGGEDLLEHVVGGGLVAGDAPRQTQHKRSVTVENLCER